MENAAINKLIADSFEKDGKLLTPAELADKADISRQKAQGHLVSYRKSLTTLFVMPNGRIRTSDGQIVWLRNSRGSMVLATHKNKEPEGHVISG